MNHPGNRRLRGHTVLLLGLALLMGFVATTGLGHQPVPAAAASVMGSSESASARDQSLANQTISRALVRPAAAQAVERTAATTDASVPPANTRWAVLLCQGTDSPIPSGLPAGFSSWPQYFTTLFTEQGAGKGGLFDYWRTVSYGKIDLTGSQVFGWYTVPYTMAQENTRSDPQKVSDCEQASGLSSATWGAFYGVMDIVGYAGGSAEITTASGPLVVSGFPGLNGPFGTPSDLAHEMGHAYGLDHSYDTADSVCAGTGRPTGEYCDPWDLMSANSVDAFADHTFATSGPGLNGPNLDALGWLPPNRVSTTSLTYSSTTTVTLAALNHPEATGVLLVKVPVRDSTCYSCPIASGAYYTIEYRQADGWDRGIPHATVLVHLVVPGHWTASPYNYISRLADSDSAPERLRCQSFLDTGDGIRITTLGINTGTGTATVQVTYTLDGYDGWLEAGQTISSRCAVKPADFLGEGRAQLTLYRPSDGTWYINSLKSGPQSPLAWGYADDIPVPADFLGEGRAQLAVFRPSTNMWYIKSLTSGSQPPIPWGQPGDIPVPGDYLGEGHAQLAVFRPSNSTWYIKSLQRGPQPPIQWGQPGDLPVPGDYLHEGRLQPAIFRPHDSYTNHDAMWYITSLQSGRQPPLQWGNADDIPVPGDYLFEGRTQLAVLRPGNATWYVKSVASGNGFTLPWGNRSDIPVPADYQGADSVSCQHPATGPQTCQQSGATDIAVFRPADDTWHYVHMTCSPSACTASQTVDLPNWGRPGDTPV